MASICGAVASPARFAHRLERQRHDGIAGPVVVEDRVAEPGAEARVPVARLAQLGRLVLERLVVGIAKPRRDLGDDGRVERQRAVLDRLPFVLDLAKANSAPSSCTRILMRAL